jgi:hypothetical protein
MVTVAKMFSFFIFREVLALKPERYGLSENDPNHYNLAGN